MRCRILCKTVPSTTASGCVDSSLHRRCLPGEDSATSAGGKGVFSDGHEHKGVGVGDGDGEDGEDREGEGSIGAGVGEKHDGGGKGQGKGKDSGTEEEDGTRSLGRRTSYAQKEARMYSSWLGRGRGRRKGGKE